MIVPELCTVSRNSVLAGQAISVRYGLSSSYRDVSCTAYQLLVQLQHVRDEVKPLAVLQLAEVPFP
jgi:hypothetical protein